MDILRKFGVVYYQLKDDFLIKKLFEDIEKVNISYSNKLFIFNHRRSAYYLKLYALIAHALSKKGYPSCFLFKDITFDHYFPIISNISKKIDTSKISSIKYFEIGNYFPKLIIDGKEISNSLVENTSKIEIIDRDCNKLKFDWEVDINKGLIESQGVNFFPLIHNTLRTIFKRYNIDFSKKEIILTANKMIKSCDLLLYYYLRLKKYSKEEELKIRIVGWESGYIPNGIFKILCDDLSTNRDIEYFDLARGYAKYFGHHHHESYIAVSNLTHFNKPSRIALDKEEFEEVSQKYSADKTLLEISKIIKKPVEKISNIKQKEIINLIDDYKSSNKNIFILFSHLFYDTPLEDSSYSFDNMCDWILKTIDYFKKTGDLLLLKPHPVESERKPNETLSSFLKNNSVKLSKNICLLNSRLFRLNEIVPYFDCGLVWRSSVALELPLYNKPSIIAGSPPYKILDLNYSKNSKNYFDMIKNVEKLKVKNEQKLDAARYILGLKDKHRHIKNITYSKKIKCNYLEKNLLNNYLKGGDKNIDSLITELLK